MTSGLHFYRALAALACGVGAACASESATTPELTTNPPNAPRPYTIHVAVDSVVRLGARLAPIVTLTTNAGEALPPGLRPLYELAVDDSVIFPYNRSGSDFALSAGYPGTATLIVTSHLPSDAVRVRVKVLDPRAAVDVTVGATVSGQVAASLTDKRYSLALSAGDTIDIAASGSTQLRQLPGSPVLEGYRLNGALVTKASLALGFSNALRVVVPATGTYAFDAVRATSGAATGPFSFEVRRGGPVLIMSYNPHGNPGSVPVPSFGFVVDTVWVRNVGSGSATASLVSDQPWIRKDGQFTVPATPFVPADTTLTQGTPVPVLLDLRGSVSAPRATVKLQADSSALISGAPLTFSGLVYDGVVRILQKNYFDRIAMTPGGMIYGLQEGKVFMVNPMSGMTTQIAARPRGYQEIVSTTDGNIFVRFCQDCNYVADTLAQVSSDGSLKIVMAFPITVNSQRPAIASGPNGDLFMQQSGTLYRRSAAGAVTVLATSLTGATEGMAYHPGEDALYYVSNGQLRKFDLVSNTESVRGPLANVRVWGVDPKGGIVGINQFKTGVYFLNTEGTAVAFLASPTTTTTLALRGNEVFGVGPAQRVTNYLWVAPIP